MTPELPSQPFGYMGCFKEKSLSNRDIKFYTSSIMTGSVCMKICHSKSSRYAVTKSKNCFCTKNISLYTESFECNYKCPRKKTEICGGKTSVSIYDTGVAVQTTVQSTTSNSSNKKTSEIAGRGTDDLVSVYISVPVLIMAVVAISIGTIYRRR
ncbi:xylosyltransferase oxt-like [Mercenaria mercenaria]|uniref:xylosyltransferase oxt-like n=1 Tax=Mercenaria mercenaria TaxID=6596 RepID=UPI00234E3BC0|nr:xylosyltransferase oxt-like [Mercenaria mercenaria]